jgi:hypothetical protein
VRIRPIALSRALVVEELVDEMTQGPVVAEEVL